MQTEHDAWLDETLEEQEDSSWEVSPDRFEEYEDVSEDFFTEDYHE